MCLDFSQPKPPPLPRTPTRQESELNASQEMRDRLRGREGRLSTVLTSPLGAPDYGKTARKATLLGQTTNILGQTAVV